MRSACVRSALFVTVLGLVLGAARVGFAQNARVSMSASSNRVAVGEPFAVEIRVETRGDDVDELELPDFGELEVLGRSTARPFSFSFGFGSGGRRAQVKSEIVHTFTLRASQPGAFTIRPAIARVAGRRIASQSLSILAIDPAHAGTNQAPRPDPSEAHAPPSGELDGALFDQTMFLRTVVDKKRAYVGQQVTVTIYLYLRGQIADSPSVTREPTLEGFWSQDLLPMQRSLSPSRQEVNGRVFNAYVLRRFAAFPLRPGALEIGAPSVEIGGGGSIFDLLTGPSQPLRRSGMKVAIEALPLPAQPTTGAPTFTGALTLEAALEPEAARVGDAVTLRVKASGQGNLRALTLPSPSVRGLEVLAPEIDDEVTNDGDQIGGERVYRWLILPRAPGEFALPPFVVDVLDPTSGSFAQARTPTLTLKVQGGEPLPAAEPPPSEEVLGVRFGPVRTASELRRRAPALYERAPYWPSVLAAPALLLALLALRFARTRLAQRSALQRDALVERELEDKLARASEAAERGDAQAALGLLSAALKGTLELRLGEPIGGMTTRALGVHLAARGLEPKLAERCLAQLGALERGRFDPAAQGALELSKAVAGVRAVTRELARARFLPKPHAASRPREKELS